MDQDAGFFGTVTDKPRLAIGMHRVGEIRRLIGKPMGVSYQSEHSLGRGVDRD